MGIDRGWQAVPETWKPFIASRADENYAALLQRILLRLARGGQPVFLNNTMEDSDASAARELIDSHPGIEHRHFTDWSRSWDAVEWLISEQRRQEREWEGFDALDSGAKAVQGSHVLSTEFSLAYSTASEVAVLARFLASFNEESLHNHYSPTSMASAEIYKFDGDIAEHEWKSVLACFEKMREVYFGAESHGEAVVVFTL